MQKIKPFLWFDNQAEEAMEFYGSVFGDFKVHDVSRYNDAGPDQAGTVVVATFELCGMEITVMNGGPAFKLTEAISLFVSCDSQEEVDEYWSKLTSDGGQESQCGWLKDKFGLSWQIIPTALPELLGDPDPAKAKRVMEAMLKMKKIDIAELERARNG